MAEGFDVEFHGDSESECTDFIKAVRKHAKRNAKIRDNQWIADELYDAFSGKALKWYVRLPVNVRGDWELLQQALITRWTAEDDNDINTSISSLAITPMAAVASAAQPPNAAPSRIYSQDEWTGKVGRVQIKTNGIAGVRYLAKYCRGPTSDLSRSGAIDTTADAALALKVRLIATTPKLYRLELVEHESELPVLAAFGLVTNDWNARYYSGLLVGVDAPGEGRLEDRRSTYEDGSQKDRRFWTESWKMKDTGVLSLCDPGYITRTARFVLFMGNHSDKDLVWFLGPNFPMSSDVQETDLVFEALEI